MAQSPKPTPQQIEKARQNRAMDLLQYTLNNLVQDRRLYSKVNCDFNVLIKVINWKLGNCINYLINKAKWKPTQVVVELENSISRHSSNYIHKANNRGDMTKETFDFFKKMDDAKRKSKATTTTNGASTTTTTTTGVTNEAKTDGNEAKTDEAKTDNGASTTTTATNEAKTDGDAIHNDNNRPETFFTRYPITSKLEPDSEDDTMDNN